MNLTSDDEENVSRKRRKTQEESSKGEEAGNEEEEEEEGDEEEEEEDGGKGEGNSTQFQLQEHTLKLREIYRRKRIKKKNGKGAIISNEKKFCTSCSWSRSGGGWAPAVSHSQEKHMTLPEHREAIRLYKKFQRGTDAKGDSSVNAVEKQQSFLEDFMRPMSSILISKNDVVNSIVDYFIATSQANRTIDNVFLKTMVNCIAEYGAVTKMIEVQLPGRTSFTHKIDERLQFLENESENSFKQRELEGLSLAVDAKKVRNVSRETCIVSDTRGNVRLLRCDYDDGASKTSSYYSDPERGLIADLLRFPLGKYVTFLVSDGPSVMMKMRREVERIMGVVSCYDYCHAICINAKDMMKASPLLMGVHRVLMMIVDFARDVRTFYVLLQDQGVYLDRPAETRFFGAPLLGMSVVNRLKQIRSALFMVELDDRVAASNTKVRERFEILKKEITDSTLQERIKFFCDINYHLLLLMRTFDRAEPNAYLMELGKKRIARIVHEELKKTTLIEVEEKKSIMKALLDSMDKTSDDPSMAAYFCCPFVQKEVVRFREIEGPYFNELLESFLHVAKQLLRRFDIDLGEARPVPLSLEDSSLQAMMRKVEEALENYFEASESFGKAGLFDQIGDRHPVTWWKSFIAKNESSRLLRFVCVRIQALIPASVTCERSHALLKEISTDLRNRMNRQRVDLLANGKIMLTGRLKGKSSGILRAPSSEEFVRMMHTMQPDSKSVDDLLSWAKSLNEVDPKEPNDQTTTTSTNSSSTVTTTPTESSAILEMSDLVADDGKERMEEREEKLVEEGETMENREEGRQEKDNEEQTFADAEPRRSERLRAKSSKLEDFI